MRVVHVEFRRCTEYAPRRRNTSADRNNSPGGDNPPPPCSRHCRFVGRSETKLTNVRREPSFVNIYRTVKTNTKNNAINKANTAGNGAKCERDGVCVWGLRLNTAGDLFRPSACTSPPPLKKKKTICPLLLARHDRKSCFDNGRWVRTIGRETFFYALNAFNNSPSTYAPTTIVEYFRGFSRPPTTVSRPVKKQINYPRPCSFLSFTHPVYHRRARETPRTHGLRERGTTRETFRSRYGGRRAYEIIITKSSARAHTGNVSIFIYLRNIHQQRRRQYRLGRKYNAFKRYGDLWITR